MTAIALTPAKAVELLNRNILELKSNTRKLLPSLALRFMTGARFEQEDAATLAAASLELEAFSFDGLDYEVLRTAQGQYLAAWEGENGAGWEGIGATYLQETYDLRNA